ncbi:MAG: rhamnose transport system permease protein [Verrucomicrobia bacterium]|nr:MAG: rhamnose transport system permease protein [Verrucomicrobiota bacterium]
MASLSPSLKKNVLRHESLLLLVLLLEFAFLCLYARNFGTPDNLSNVVRHSAEIGLLALAMMPVILTGGIDLSVGSLMGLCAVLFGVLTHDYHLATLPAAAVTLAAGLFAGGFNAFLITALRLPPLIVTLGTYSLFRGLAEAITQGTKTYRAFDPAFLSLGETRWFGVPLQAWILTAAAASFYLLVHRSTFGRSFRAIGFSPEGARYAGLSVQSRTALPYLLTGLVAALAALLFTARLRQARADAGTGYELCAITAVVLGGTSIFGGVGTLPGTLAGIAAIAVLTNGIGRVPAVFKAGIGGELASLLTGALLLVALAGPELARVLSTRSAKISPSPKTL